MRLMKTCIQACYGSVYQLLLLTVPFTKYYYVSHISVYCIEVYGIQLLVNQIYKKEKKLVTVDMFH